MGVKTNFAKMLDKNQKIYVPYKPKVVAPSEDDTIFSKKGVEKKNKAIEKEE